LQDHVEAVNALLKDAETSSFGGDSLEHDTWDGIQDETPVEPIDHEAEYIDEDRFTTVIVEAVDVTKEGLHKIVEDEEETRSQDDGKVAFESTAKTNTKKNWPKKVKKQKFRYESKAERKVTRGKQKAGNKSKADARRGND